MIEVVSLEMQRARQALERFCAARNSARQSSGKSLCCEVQGEDLILAEYSAPTVSGEHPVCLPLVRLSYRDGSWSLYWRTSGDWVPYPHLPATDSVQRIVDELEQAPLHVHWG